MKQQQTTRLLNLCKQPSSQRTQANILYIRDRLHECSSFFRLWPSQLQQLLCRLLETRGWVQNEVLAAAGSRPDALCIIVDGQAAVAVRSAPGSSLLKDIAVLRPGDTFGELCLLGKQRHPAFVVARSPVVTCLAVDAQVLAAAMLVGLQQARSPSRQPRGDSNIQQSANCPEGPEQRATMAAQLDSGVNVEALYQLIGEPRGQPTAVLSPQQALQVRELYTRQLKEAAAAEAATVGAWQQLPHERLPGPAPCSNSGPDCTARLHSADDDALLGKQCSAPSSSAPSSSASTPAAGTGAHPPGASAEPQVQQGPGFDDGSSSGAQGAALGCPGVADAHGCQQQQQQQHRSPLMHHAAIMHFAALKAAAAAAGAEQPSGQ